MTIEQIQRTPTGRLIDLKRIVGKLTVEKIDRELERRIRAAALSTTVTGVGATDLAARRAEIDAA